MFESLKQAEAAIATLVAALDADRAAATDAPTALAHLERLVRVLEAAKMRLASRVADTAAWRAGGHRSPAHWLAAQTGASIRHADDLLDTAARLKDLPDLDAAVRHGQLSTAQTVEIAAAATADPSTEAELVAAASGASLRELTERCRAVRAAAVADPDARHQAIRAARFLTHGIDGDGAFVLRARTTADDGADLAAAIEAWQDQIFAAARAEGRRERIEAYAVDALVALARASVGGAADATRPSARKVIVRVDHTALIRGRAEPGETCEIAGVGPIPASVAAALAGDAFLAAIVTKGRDVLTVAHLGRQVTAHQRTALEWRDARCRVLGCGSAARLEIDHRTGWALTHTTCLDDLDRLCRFHHMLKTTYHWRLEPGTGTRRFLPPPAAGPPP